MTTHDERVERVAAAIADSENGEGYWEHINEWSGDWLEEKHNHQEVERITAMARAAVAAMDAEPPLEDVLKSVPWLSALGVQWTEDEVYRAELSGYVHEDGYRGGEGTGPTIAQAIRDAVRAAKEGE